MDEKESKTNVILSMTSIPSRLERLVPIIRNLICSQSYPFNCLLLYLPSYCVRQKKKYVIPPELTQLQNERFQIRPCDVDNGPATKIIPAMDDHRCCPRPSVLISVDDDVFLESHAIEELVLAHKRYPHSILGFSGVIAPHFLHGDFMMHQSFEVILLGGYRAILYPQFVFDSFSNLFSLYRSENMRSWPLPAIDDDYLLSKFAEYMRVPCQLVGSIYRREDRTINIKFDHNTDGVSGQQGKDCHIHSSRQAIDFFFDRYFESSDVHMMHIICNSPTNPKKFKRQGGKKIISHPLFENAMPKSLIIACLQRFFHPTVRVCPKQDQKIDYVLISSWRTLVDVTQMKQIARWHQRFQFCTPPRCCLRAGTFVNGVCDRNDNLLPLLLTWEEVQNVVSTKKQHISSVVEWEPSYPLHWPDFAHNNIARVACLLTTDLEQRAVLCKHWAERRVAKKVKRVFYGPIDITVHLFLICKSNKKWRCDGSNAQMDNLIGDMLPGVPKCIEIHIQHENVIFKQNTDWQFFLDDNHLMVE